MPCATGVADCSVLDEANIDGRTGQLKLKDAPAGQPIVMMPSAGLLADVQPKRISDVLAPDTHPPDSSPPLSVLYCVYLI